MDGGETWSLKEVTEDIYSLFDDAPQGCVQSCFIASGSIFQSEIIKVGSHYRIYAALTARPNGNRVLYSDDFGRTWSVLGGLDALPAPYGDEAKCAELPDGRVVLSSRAMGGRYFNIFTYTDIGTAAGSWGEAAPSGRRGTKSAHTRREKKPRAMLGALFYSVFSGSSAGSRTVEHTV